MCAVVGEERDRQREAELRRWVGGYTHVHMLQPRM